MNRDEFAAELAKHEQRWDYSQGERMVCGCGVRFGNIGSQIDPDETHRAHIADAVLPLIEADVLERAADDIQALHPGEKKNSVEWLRERARIARGADHA